MPKTDPGVAGRVEWEADFAVGHAMLDTQHQALLAQCNILAEHCAGPAGEAGHPAFDQGFESLKALVRAHLATEASLLADCGAAGLEDHDIELEEFEHLCSEVATLQNFDRPELQRFFALWCVGHIQGLSPAQRARLAGAGTAGTAGQARS